jgi:hypothetical protein
MTGRGRVNLAKQMHETPRTLKARIGWIDSILRWTWQRAWSVKAREYWSGVGER